MNNNNNETVPAIDPEELDAREKNYKHVLLQVSTTRLNYLFYFILIHMSLYGFELFPALPYTLENRASLCWKRSKGGGEEKIWDVIPSAILKITNYFFKNS